VARYLLAVNFEGGVVDTPMEEWKPEEIQAHLDYYKALSQELRESGELVQSEILTGPDLAKIVTSDGTTPVVTDGPYVEKHTPWLAVPDGHSRRGKVASCPRCGCARLKPQLVCRREQFHRFAAARQRRIVEEGNITLRVQHAT
jgi:hypothetical protein